MMKVPGYEKALRRSAKQRLRERKNNIRHKNKNIADEVLTPRAAGVAAGVVGASLGAAAFVWLIRNHENIMNAVPGKLSVLVMLLGLPVLGAGLGFFLVQKGSRAMGVRIMNKIYEEKQLSRLEQKCFPYLFDFRHLCSSLIWDRSAAFRALCDGKLPHVSYDTATQIMDAHLRYSSDDYAVLAKAFDKSSIPEYIQQAYDKGTNLHVR